MSALAGWVHVTHPDTGGAQLIPDSEDVIEAHVARGWVLSEAIPAELDPDAPNLGATPAAGPALAEPEAVEQPAAEPAPEQPAQPVKTKTKPAGSADEKNEE